LVFGYFRSIHEKGLLTQVKHSIGYFIGLYKKGLVNVLLEKTRLFSSFPVSIKIRVATISFHDGCSFVSQVCPTKILDAHTQGRIVSSLYYHIRVLHYHWWPLGWIWCAVCCFIPSPTLLHQRKCNHTIHTLTNAFTPQRPNSKRTTNNWWRNESTCVERAFCYFNLKLIFGLWKLIQYNIDLWKLTPFNKILILKMKMVISNLETDIRI